MVKYLFQFGLSIFLFIGIQSNVFADDFDIIYNQFYAESLTNSSPSQTETNTILSLINANGSFSNINYNTTDDILVHLDYMNKMAFAYAKTNSTYYHSQTLLNKYISTLEYWVNLNHNPSNWWFREIGYPNTLSTGYVLMIKAVQTQNPTVYNNSISYLKAGYSINRNMEGANGADKIMGAFLASIITKNTSDMATYQSHIAQLLVVQNQGEGIEADWMWAAHSYFGRQLNANYLVEFLNSHLRYLKFTKGTAYYKENNVTFLEDIFIKSVQWYLYNKHIDPAQTGRANSSIKGVDRLIIFCKTLLDLNGPKSNEMALVYDRLNNGSSASTQLVGNNMCWRFNYMINRRQGYYVSNRMSSTNTLGLESAPEQHEENFFGGSGINFIFRTGNEYGDESFFDVFNYKQWPGITAEQDNTPLPTVHWGEGAQGGNDFAGGVSDGMYGASAFIHQKLDVTANKGWFYFDNEFVALGCGINQINGTHSIYTTLNQTIQSGDIQYSKNSNIQTINGSATVSEPDWILQNGIGYINMNQASVYKIFSDTRSPFPSKIFTASIDHGINPVNGTYAYVVYPNSNSTILTNYKTNPPIQILSNTTNVQSIYHKELDITEAIFYRAGNLSLADGRVISVNRACALILKKDGNNVVLTVANPLCEIDNPATITLTINQQLTGNGATSNGNNTTIVINLPQGDYAGQSVSQSFNTAANQLPIITILTPTNNQTYISPANVSITTDIIDPDGTVDMVVFFEGTNWIGSDSEAPFSLEWKNVPDGDYKISVKAIDNTGEAQYNSVDISVNTTTYLNTLNQQTALIYPNPTSGILHISSSIDKIKLVDIIGRVYFFDNNNEIDLSNFQEGLYLVYIYEKGKKETFITNKLIIKK